MRKDRRSLKVVPQGRESVPTIILKGKWLEELGFEPGIRVIVRCEDEKLTIESTTIFEPV